ncbi:hypothetical protein SEA_LEOPARD_50 [Mycobacterium phage Leopard]|uniref:Uncharacterized protein n=1 Tax=Mycobacterium phage Onyinye TaxID=2686235 RepID=A0A6B9L726_9CAUD|nr:hypothetical protein PP339_gp051 [Mycobacterium phage Onyinye]QHB37512.1 hypothetical protein SEA_ONYINYE_51 [Mycobacterium phage Onyinye]UOW92982.1 hypothetical protein SEA_LEOPARD_50 [Mycobacterium phage Leopard]WKW85212.1 hypothetical protein SEA_AIKOY__50 [Mycobacterium phage Aikoy]
MILLLAGSAPVSRAAPYVSCIDGHIVSNIKDCPPVVRTPPSSGPYGGGPAPRGGGGRGGGLLGGIIGGIL